MLEWDEAREAFVRQVRALGVAVRVFLVHEGTTRRPWSAVSPELANFALLTPSEVERRLAEGDEA
jgi:hypothetical protein